MLSLLVSDRDWVTGSLPPATPPTCTWPTHAHWGRSLGLRARIISGVRLKCRWTVTTDIGDPSTIMVSVKRQIIIGCQFEINQMDFLILFSQNTGCILTIYIRNWRLTGLFWDFWGSLRLLCDQSWGHIDDLKSLRSSKTKYTLCTLYIYPSTLTL